MSVPEAGDLVRMPLAAVLLEAFGAGVDGVLSVAHGGATSRLFLRDGRPVGAQVVRAGGFRPLGAILLQTGKIDAEVLSRSLATMARTGRLQGEILVEMDAVAREDVEAALIDQQAGYFAIIASLESGPWSFEHTAKLPDWTRNSFLRHGSSLVDALQRPPAAGLVEAALEPVIVRGVRLSPAHADAARAFGWTPAEAALVARLQEPAATEAFLLHADVPPERARALLATVILAGFAIPADVTREERTHPVGVVELVREEAPSPGTTVAPRRSDPAQASARRRRFVARALRNVGVGPLAGSIPPPSVEKQTPSTKPAGAPPRTAAPGSPEEELRQALLDAASRLHDRDLFVRLGVAESATRDDVERAFVALAKKFHPDRFASTAFDDLQGLVHELFCSLNEAHEVLSNDRRRAEYLSRRK